MCSGLRSGGVAIPSSNRPTRRLANPVLSPSSNRPTRLLTRWVLSPSSKRPTRLLTGWVLSPSSKRPTRARFVAGVGCTGPAWSPGLLRGCVSLLGIGGISRLVQRVFADPVVVNTRGDSSEPWPFSGLRFAAAGRLRLDPVRGKPAFSCAVCSSGADHWGSLRPIEQRGYVARVALSSLELTHFRQSPAGAGVRRVSDLSIVIVGATRA